jgi:serine/threonine protein phosphatase PrpC
LADGCNWGSRAFNAAKAAIAAYDEYVDENSQQMSDLQDTGHILLRAFAKAHNKIFEGKDDIWEAGTTTLFGGVLLQIEPPKSSDARWALLCSNVGDCKAFLYSKSTQNVIDITSGDTIYVKDRCDPGGRLVRIAARVVWPEPF